MADPKRDEPKPQPQPISQEQPKPAAEQREQARTAERDEAEIRKAVERRAEENPAVHRTVHERQVRAERAASRAGEVVGSNPPVPTPEAAEAGVQVLEEQPPQEQAADAFRPGSGEGRRKD